ncbi:MAG: Stp1/IreP family PP2C-type Ser/Thr phosphatase [Clostridia bacterium]
MDYKFAFRTDIGKRPRNEDSLYVPEEGARPLFIIADGIGGHKAGAVASKLAVRSVAEYVEQSTQSDLRATVQVASAYANSLVYAEGQSNKEYSDMGTTLAFALLATKSFIVANIGDSRIYHFDGISLTQITKDHSFAAELLEAGEITEEEAKRHPRRNVITRALGTEPTEHPDIFEAEWGTGDLLMLCTDGIFGGVSDCDIKQVLKNATDLGLACDNLIELCREGGATDNATVVLVQNMGVSGDA